MLLYLDDSVKRLDRRESLEMAVDLCRAHIPRG